MISSTRFFVMAVMAVLLVVSVVSAADTDIIDNQQHHNRRLTGGYSGSFCRRTLDDCCGDAKDEATGQYPRCRCPKRKKGGLDEPICLFGFCTGSYTDICETCATRCAEGGDLDCSSS